MINYIISHSSEALSLKQIASQFSISHWHLSKTFAAYTGLNFIEYVNNIRLREACFLLINSDKTITDIALDTGFNSLTSFERVFKSFYAITPKAYRKAIQSQP